MKSSESEKKARIERGRRLLQNVDPEEAKRFLESLPEIDDDAGTLALVITRRKQWEEEEQEEAEE